MNMWTTKSKYGATIQTALNYVMGIDPKHEDMGDIFPHVAAVAAASIVLARTSGSVPPQRRTDGTWSSLSRSLGAGSTFFRWTCR